MPAARANQQESWALVSGVAGCDGCDYRQSGWRGGLSLLPSKISYSRRLGDGTCAELCWKRQLHAAPQIGRSAQRGPPETTSADFAVLRRRACHQPIARIGVTTPKTGASI